MRASQRGPTRADVQLRRRLGRANKARRVHTRAYPAPPLPSVGAAPSLTCIMPAGGGQAAVSACGHPARDGRSVTSRLSRAGLATVADCRVGRLLWRPHGWLGLANAWAHRAAESQRTPTLPACAHRRFGRARRTVVRSAVALALFLVRRARRPRQACPPQPAAGNATARNWHSKL